MKRLKDYSYDAYLKEQVAKKTDQDKLLYAERRFEGDYRAFRSRFWCYSPFIRGEAICLGSRLGAEVKALRDLGHAGAFGIDIGEYDAEQKYVVYGDFMDMQYDDHTFDFSYTNSLDHAFSLEGFLKEVGRVMKPGGFSLFDIGGSQSFHIWKPESFGELRRAIEDEGHHVLMTKGIRHPWRGQTFLIKWHIAPSLHDRMRLGIVKGRRLLQNLYRLCKPSVSLHLVL